MNMDFEKKIMDIIDDDGKFKKDIVNQFKKFNDNIDSIRKNFNDFVSNFEVMVDHSDENDYDTDETVSLSDSE